MAKVQKDPIIGKQFGYLTVVEVTQLGNSSKGTSKKVIAKCICGVVKEYFLRNLRKKNHTTSCGCHKIRIAGDAVRTHGLSGRNPLYNVWAAIKRRCYNKNSKSYPFYGGIGVKMCEEWRDDYKSFYDWCIDNGWEKGLQIDKDIKPKEKGISALLYSPEMCTIVTCKRNQNARGNNILIQYKGEIKTLKQIAEQCGIKYLLLWRRYVQLKWGIERAILTPPRIVDKYK